MCRCLDYIHIQMQQPGPPFVSIETVAGHSKFSVISILAPNCSIMWLDLAVLFVACLSMITAHPSKENALGAKLSKRDDLALALGQVDVPSPGGFSGFNDGAAASNYLPVNNVLASSGATSSLVDQPLGDIFRTDEQPTVPVDQPLGGNFGLDVVGFLTKPSDDTTLQSNGNVAQDQISDELFRADDTADTPAQPCTPHQQSAKLRRRDWCRSPAVNSNTNGNGNGNGNGKTPQRLRPPRVETSPLPPSVQPEFDDKIDSDCVTYSSGWFRLGVCSSAKPNMVLSSNFNDIRIRSPVKRLLDADLGKFISLAGKSTKQRSFVIFRSA